MSEGLRKLPARPQGELPGAPYDRWLLKDGGEAALFCRLDNGYLVRFPDQADYTIARDWSVTCAPVPDADPETLTHLYHNQIAPLIASHNGALVLHGSAVSIHGSALGFIGSTGDGKSTLAGAFATAGYPFLTDDGLKLELRSEQYIAIPARPHVRLRSDSEANLLGTPTQTPEAGPGNKHRVPASAALPFQDTPLPLARLYLLRNTADADRIAIEPLDPAASLAALMQHSFILDVENRARLRAHFDQIAALALAIPCFALDYPRQYGYLAQVIERVLQHSPKKDQARESE